VTTSASTLEVGLSEISPRRTITGADIAAFNQDGKVVQEIVTPMLIRRSSPA
jgi:hypothetical protein